ncbi:MAG: hypothetical protein OEM52_11260 [bacterium]|nr:hypothetical protein [bacterium]
MSNNPVNETKPSTESFGWLERLEILAKHRKFLLRWILLWTILGVVAAFVWPPTYKAVSSFMPPTEDGNSLLGALSSTLRMSNVSDVQSGGFNAVLTSKRLRDSLNIRFDFMKRYGVDKLEKAYKEFDNRFEINTLVEEGIGINQILTFYISVTDKNPNDAAAMANAVIDYTDAIASKLTSTRQHNTRVFLEKRTMAVKESLQIAEDSLRLFSQRTGIISPEAQIEATITTLQTVEKNIAEIDVALYVAKTTMGGTHPQVKELEAKITELSKQRDEISGKIDRTLSSNLIALKDSPELTLEFTRRYRAVQVQETMLVFLIQQLEQARLGEQRDQKVLHYLDQAISPEVRRWPIRSLVVVLAVALGLFSALVIIGWKEWIIAMEGSEQYTRLKDLLRQFYPKYLWKAFTGKG